MNRTYIKILTVSRSTVELQELRILFIKSKYKYKYKSVGRKGLEPSTAQCY
jgi:hypothetical protein